MTAALRQPVLTDATEIWGLLWGGASVPTEASGANPLAEQSPNAGATAAMTPGQSSDSSVAPCPKIGRPKGSFSSPLAAWIRHEVKQKRREGWGRREAFNIAADTEQRIDRDHFQLSEWTADEAGIETVDEDGNDRPAKVSWSNWKKLWLETGH